MPSVIPIKMEWKITPHSNVMEAVVVTQTLQLSLLGVIRNVQGR